MKSDANPTYLVWSWQCFVCESLGICKCSEPMLKNHEWLPTLIQLLAGLNTILDWDVINFIKLSLYLIYR